MMHPVGPLGDRLKQGELVGVLERATMPGGDRRGAAERDDGRAIRPGMGDAGDEVRGRGARGCHAEAGFVQKARIGEASKGGRLLVAHVYAAKPELEACGFHRQHRTAHDVEKVADAFMLHRLRNDV
jgi:hypothetical protein